MNREVKFRAWDKMEHRMLYRTIYDGNWYATPENDDRGCHCVCRASPSDRTWLEIMEFTGLKDANGRDVYEGDLVHTQDGRIRKITWNEDQAAFSQDDEYGKNQYRWPFTCDDAFLCEVVGNVWENPEMVREEE